MLLKKISESAFYSLYLAAILLTYWVKDNAFFWDTIQLAARHAHFYFENNFESFFLPEAIDSGHPPTFGIYLAVVWKWLGKSLAASHFAMLPFLLGIIFFTKKIANLFFQSAQWQFAFVLLLMLDPCFLGQAALVTPDIVIVLFFLMSVYGVVSQRKVILMIGIIGLSLTSMRGYMIGGGIFLFDMLNEWLIHRQKSLVLLFKKIIPYLPGGMLAIIFLGLHYQHTRWIGYHEGSPWAPAFERVDLMGAVKNVGLIVWRMLDFGRVFLWIAILFIGIKFLRKKIKLDATSKQLLLLFVALIIFLCPSLIIHQNLTGHRYLLPLFIVVDFLAMYWVYYLTVSLRQIIPPQRVKSTFQIPFLTLIFLGLFTGNFWVYPKQIAQGWDSTLAHLPYYDLRNQMKSYLHKEQIPFEAVGSVFPNVVPFRYTDLENTMDSFSKKDLKNQHYIFYSNVFNDFSDDELEELENHWQIKKEFRKMNVCVVLYTKELKVEN
ncbi:MAG: hypothetical protein AAF573_10155 [Bacteroidota bacterium]